MKLRLKFVLVYALAKTLGAVRGITWIAALAVTPPGLSALKAVNVTV